MKIRKNLSPNNLPNAIILKFLLLGAVWSSLLQSCGGDDKPKDEPQATTVQDTTLQIQGNMIRSLDYTPKYIQSAFQGKGLGTTDIPTTIKIDAKNWVNNLDQIVGRIIKIEKVDTNNVATIRPLRSICKNQDSLRKFIKVPIEAEMIEHSYKKERAFELSFLGINTNINKNQEYRYLQTEILTLTIADNLLDTTKVPKQYRCQGENCNYYYVLTGSANKIETSLFTSKGNKVAVKDLSGFGVVKPIGGNVYLADEKRDMTRHYIVFLTLVELNTLFDQ